MPMRASVVRDRYGTQFFVSVPRALVERVEAIPGAKLDAVIDRYVVPASQETALRGALAGWADQTWREDHRTVHRCEACKQPLSQLLTGRGERLHIGCGPDAPKRQTGSRGALWPA